jgi:dihydroorotate dehydrogenase (fumarate)/dihydroorotate dehydrogenase
MNLYRSVIGPALFKLPADRGHDLAHRALAWPPPWRALSAASGLVVTDPRLKTRFAGLDLPNPVGLAAGFDKDAELTDALSWLGFGFICVGSIMPEPRPGNPFPRLVRFTHNASLADSMGVPSRGRGYAIARLRRRKSCQTSARAVPIFANIGGFSADSLAQGIAELRPLVDAVEISLMCPNVQAPGETFDEIGMLRGLIDRLTVDPGAIVVRVPNDTTLNHDRGGALYRSEVRRPQGRRRPPDHRAETGFR